MAEDYMKHYNIGMQKSREKMGQQAAYATQIAEQMGRYTPELEQMALAPLGQYPTVGENLITAPIRGLGKLFGSESMQQVGAPQPFTLPQPQQQGGGVSGAGGMPSEFKDAFQSYINGLKGGQGGVTPSFPSEMSGNQPVNLKTEGQRNRERKQMEQAFEWVKGQMEWERDRESRESLINQRNQQVLESQAREKQINKLIQDGPTPNHYSFIQDVADKAGKSLWQVEKEWKELGSSNTQSRAAQFKELHRLGFVQNWDEFLKGTDDFAGMAWNKTIGSIDGFMKYRDNPEAFATDLEKNTIILMDNAKRVMDRLNKRKNKGKLVVDSALKAEGYDENVIRAWMVKYNMNWDEAQKTMMRHVQKIKSRTPNAPTTTTTKTTTATKQ